MSTSATPTHQDDCLTLLRVVADAPTGGVSMRGIQDVVNRAGHNWSLLKINDLLCAVRAQVSHEKRLVRGQGKATMYSLKTGS